MKRVSFKDFKKVWFENVVNSGIFAIFNKETGRFLQYYEIVPDRKNNKYRIYVVGLSYLRPEEFDSKKEAADWIKGNDKVMTKEAFLSYRLEKIAE